MRFVTTTTRIRELGYDPEKRLKDGRTLAEAVEAMCVAKAKACGHRCLMVHEGTARYRYWIPRRQPA